MTDFVRELVQNFRSLVPIRIRNFTLKNRNRDERKIGDNGDAVWRKITCITGGFELLKTKHKVRLSLSNKGRMDFFTESHVADNAPTPLRHTDGV